MSGPIVQAWRERILKAQDLAQLKDVTDELLSDRQLAQVAKTKIWDELVLRKGELIKELVTPESADRTFGDGKESSPASRAEAFRKAADIVEKSAPLADPALATVLAKSGPAALLTVTDAAKDYGIPPHMILLFRSGDGSERPYVTKDGLMALVKRSGFRAVETRVDKDPEHEDGWIAEAKIYRDLRPEDQALLEKFVAVGDHDLVLQAFRELTRPTIAHGSANPGNVRMGTMKSFLRELAETRAFCRAARIYTGLGIRAIEEEGE